MRLLWAVLLSLAVHLVLMIFIEQLPLPPAKQNLVEFELKPASTSQKETKPNFRASSVVREVDLPKSYQVKEVDDRLRFLSSKVQRVKEQTKAALSGLTQNQIAATPGPQKQKKESSQGANGKNSAKDFDPLAAARSKRSLPGADSISSGYSTIEHELDGVKIGAITSLNTEQVLFYSFYSRAVELFYFRWVTLARQAVDVLSSRPSLASTNDRWTTELDIWLKPNGEYHSAHVLKESGISEFDRAAVGAFRQAGFFPNPPKELVEDDGFIHLRYSLMVYYAPKVLVRQ